MLSFARATLLIATRVSFGASLGGVLRENAFLRMNKQLRPIAQIDAETWNPLDSLASNKHEHNKHDNSHNKHEEHHNDYATKTSTKSTTSAKITKAVESSKMAGCSDKVPQDQRILLTSNAQAMHGTTALMTLLMSSNRVSTLCAGKSWECEGFTLAWEKGDCDATMTNCKRELPPLLDMFSAYWKLERPVLFDKEFPDQRKYSAMLSEAEIPRAMKDIGIKRVDRAHVFMWTPLCVRSLTDSPPFAPWTLTFGHNNTDYDERARTDELRTLELLRDEHTRLVSEGVPVLVINYADLLWEPDATVRRLRKFMPCLGDLSVDFVPKMNSDVFPENCFKVRGTLRDFGKQNPAAKGGYSIGTHKCSNQTLYDQLSSPLRHRFDLAEAYFQKLSV